MYSTHIPDLYDNHYQSFTMTSSLPPYCCKIVQRLSEALLHNTSLTKLHSTPNNISHIGVAIFATALIYNTSLQELEMGFNEIKCSGAEKLANGLSHNNSLKKLELSYNKIKKHGIEKLFHAIGRNSSLEILILSGNDMSGVENFRELLHCNTYLKHLELNETKIGDWEIEKGIKKSGQRYKCTCYTKWATPPQP